MPGTKKRHPSISASRIETEVWSAPDVATFENPWNNRILIDYYLDLLKAHGYIRLLGLPQLKDNPDIPIESLFVEPEFIDTSAAVTRPAASGPSRFTLSQAVANYPRSVVLGDPGAGKTSLMQWLVVQFCRASGSPLQQRLGPLVPMPFILREMPLSESMTWNDLISLFLNQNVAAKLREHATLVKQLLLRGQALIMLDGLDEVSSHNIKKTLREAVHEGIIRENKCRWLMTSRIIGYDRLPFHGAPVVRIDGVGASEVRFDVRKSSTVLHLAPFSDRQIEALVRNWYSERESDSNRRDESIKSFLSAIKEHSGTYNLARTPNLLTMMALIHRVRARLPQGRVNLYTDIVAAYLQTIDDFRGIREVSYTLAQKKQWLSRIAFELQLKRREHGKEDASGILAERKHIYEWLSDEMRHVEPTETDEAVQRFIDYLQRRTGLFIERSDGNFAFVHLSFQEYFAAFYLAEEVTSPDWLLETYRRAGAEPNDLRAYVSQAVWKETLVFLFELLGQERPRWVNAVAKEVFAKTNEKPSTPELLSRDPDDPVFRWPQDPDVQLLADLSVNSYSGFSTELRRKAWETVWRCSFPEGSFTVSNPPVDILFAGAPQYIPLLWECLIGVAEGMGDKPLNLTGCSRLMDISPIAKLQSLKRLYLSGSEIQTGLSELGHMKSLADLDITWPGSLVHPMELANCSQLKELDIDCSDTRFDAGTLPVLPVVNYLRFSSFADLRNLKALNSWNALTKIALSCFSFKNFDFTFLLELRNIVSLSIDNAGTLNSLKQLECGTTIKSLNVWRSPLKSLMLNPSLRELREISLSHCDVSDLYPLAIPTLETIFLSNCKHLSSLEPLLKCSNLKQIKIDKCPALVKIPPELEKLIMRI